MALSQRLEFRQSQSLVMTPQLMQAIKLLQLSNLDLATFVEDEIEKNPLLDRASDSAEPPVSGEQTAEGSGEFSSGNEEGAGGEATDFGDAGAPSAFEPGAEDWMHRDLGSRSDIEQTLDTGMENVFPEEP